MPLSGRVWGAGKLLVLAAVVLGTYVLFFLFGVRLALKTREVVVPDLTGRTVNEATTRLAELGLALRVEEPARIDPRIPPGRIAAQEPPAGVTTRRPRAVKVWTSAGARAGLVPGVVGELETAALARVEEAGLKLAARAEIRTSQYPAGVIVAQTPPPGSRATEIALLVNLGERGTTYVMPDLIGTQAARAAELLRARGFRVAIVSEYPYPGVPPGYVLRQRPEAGFQIAPGEAISLEVSR
jgi:beta-lactam-binding protein with PASTA domain